MGDIIMGRNIRDCEEEIKKYHNQHKSDVRKLFDTSGKINLEAVPCYLCEENCAKGIQVVKSLERNLEAHSSMCKVALSKGFDPSCFNNVSLASLAIDAYRTGSQCARFKARYPGYVFDESC